MPKKRTSWSNPFASGGITNFDNMRSGGDERFWSNRMSDLRKNMKPGTMFINKGKVWIATGMNSARSATPSEVKRANPQLAAQMASQGSLGPASGSPYQQATQAQQQAGVQMADPTDLIRDAMAEYRQGVRSARAANEKRYAQLLGGYGQLEKENLEDQKKTGVLAEHRIGEAVQRQLGGALQTAYETLGGAGASGIESLKRGYSRLKQHLLMENTERQAKARQNIRTRHREGKLGVMERRTDLGPNAGLYSQLLSTLGQGMGYGAGGPAGTGATAGAGTGTGVGQSTYQRIRATTRPGGKNIYQQRKRTFMV